MPSASGTAPGTAVYGGVLTPADVTEAGGLGHYGTMAQGGNTYEWNETVLDADFIHAPNLGGRALRGGDYGNAAAELSSMSGGNLVPSADMGSLGFRVVSVVPEPSAMILFGIGSLGVLHLMKAAFRNGYVNTG